MHLKIFFLNFTYLVLHIHLQCFVFFGGRRFKPHVLSSVPAFHHSLQILLVVSLLCVLCMEGWLVVGCFFFLSWILALCLNQFLLPNYWIFSSRQIGGLMSVSTYAVYSRSHWLSLLVNSIMAKGNSQNIFREPGICGE